MKSYKNVFQMIDKNNSGTIELEELKAFMKGSCYSPEQTEKLFRQLDKNGDGRISLEEYLEAAKIFFK